MSTTVTALPAGLTAGTWAIDPSHSLVEFTVRHLMVAKVRGRFSDLPGQNTAPEQPTKSSVQGTIHPATVDTRDQARDNHLRTSDFFEVHTFPTWTFKSTGVRPTDDRWIVTGDLTLRGITRTVELPVEVNGTQAH